MFDLPCGVRLRAYRPTPATGSGVASDADSIVGIYNDPALAALVTLHFIVPRGPSFMAKFQAAIESDAEMFCIIESIPGATSNAQPEFLGFTALWAHVERGHRLAHFSLVLLPGGQNRGVGTAITRFMLEHAFMHLNMHRVALGVRGDNARAINVYRKCGFVEEGCERQAYWTEGAWRDCVNMGILADEWRALQEKPTKNDAAAG